MSIDFIITTRNRLDRFQQTMTSFLGTVGREHIRRLIVANDGSTDGTAEYVQRLAALYPFVMAMPDQENHRGLIPRFNAAFSLCDADVVCEFQDDVVFERGWLVKQLEALPYADFVTGFDAPEHQAFGTEDGYTIKHSSRFTQLLARRETWARWFPLAPRHDFPTPANVDGVRVGSGIDTALSGRRVNSAIPDARFVVVPSVQHMAEDPDSSTWRGDGSVVPLQAGGIEPARIKHYWRDRHAKQYANAVGYAGRDKEYQAKLLREKVEFIGPLIETERHGRVLDYGCGIGAMSVLFDPDRYLGVDVTGEFLEIARQENAFEPLAPTTDEVVTESAVCRAYEYQLLDEPRLALERPFDFTCVFMANVLQHNSDDAALAVLQSIRGYKQRDFTFVLYENTDPRKGTDHMRFRRPNDYVKLVEGAGFLVKQFETQSHTVHGERHSLMKLHV